MIVKIVMAGGPLTNDQKLEVLRKKLWELASITGARIKMVHLLPDDLGPEVFQTPPNRRGRRKPW